MKARWIGIPLVAMALLLLPACGSDEDASDQSDDATEATSKGADTKAAAKPKGGPPADYVKWKCSTCSCRVFAGDGAECTRPSCRHNWSEHQRPAEAP